MRTYYISYIVKQNKHHKADIHASLMLSEQSEGSESKPIIRYGYGIGAGILGTNLGFLNKVQPFFRSYAYFIKQENAIPTLLLSDDDGMEEATKWPSSRRSRNSHVVRVAMTIHGVKSLW